MAAAKKKTRTRPVRQGKDLRDVDKAFVHHVMFSEGIVPIENADHDMGRALKNTTPEEARKLKRKFRKLWRKTAKAELEGMKLKGRHDAFQKSLDRRLGKGKRVPSRHERMERKKLVLEALWNEKISPLLDVFENPDNPNNKKKEVDHQIDKGTDT